VSCFSTLLPPTVPLRQDFAGDENYLLLVLGSFYVGLQVRRRQSQTDRAFIRAGSPHTPICRHISTAKPQSSSHLLSSKSCAKAGPEPDSKSSSPAIFSFLNSPNSLHQHVALTFTLEARLQSRATWTAQPSSAAQPGTLQSYRPETRPLLEARATFPCPRTLILKREKTRFRHFGRLKVSVHS
jgi:hypothetical protein